MSIAATEPTEPTEPTVYAEDLSAGDIVDLGTYRMTEEDLYEFAGQWDPQRFHTDPQFAQQGHFGGIIASGIHSLAIFQRLAVLKAYRHWWVVAGRSIQDIQFHAPVRPGMELQGRLEVTDVQFKREDRALVTLHGTLSCEGQLLFEMTNSAWIWGRARQQQEPQPA